jgi:uncharacterized OB-fold protein
MYMADYRAAAGTAVSRVTGAAPAGAAKTQVLAVDGWFTIDEGRAYLLGSRCASCRTVVFPPHSGYCPNPRCDGDQFAQIRLSRRGRIWSYTTSAYPPPPPFVASDPYVPVTIAAVELETEKIVVLGQVASGTPGTELAVGMEMELTAEPLYEDDQSICLVWKWRRAGSEDPGAGGEAGGAAAGQKPGERR